MAAPPLPGPEDSWALFLDIDGTLVSIAATPQAVKIDPPLLALLERLRLRCGGAVALVSGRPIASIDRLFRPLVLPAAGVHGWERRRADGTLVLPLPTPSALEALRPRLAAFAEAHPGLLLEDKGESLALHYRLGPAHELAARALAEQLTGAAEGALRLIPGDKVLEFQGRGTDKGTAIRDFLREEPFIDRLPVFAGDDVSDEDGFAAVDALGGLTVKVGDHGAGDASVARHALPDDTALRAWLDNVADALDAASARRKAERQRSNSR